MFILRRWKILNITLFGLRRKWKQTITFWKFLWIFRLMQKKKERHENVKPLKISSLPSNKDKWQKWETQVTLKESCNFGEAWQGNWTTYNWAPRNSFDLTAVQGTATFSASCLSSLPLKVGSPVFIHGVFIHEDSSHLAWNDAWKRETIGRQLLWVSSLLLSQRPHCYSPVKWRKWGKGTGAGAAAASGLSILPGSRHTFPFPTGPLKTGGAEHIYLCMIREKEIALIELGIMPKQLQTDEMAKMRKHTLRSRWVIITYPKSFPVFQKYSVGFMLLLTMSTLFWGDRYLMIPCH